MNQPHPTPELNLLEDQLRRFLVCNTPSASTALAAEQSSP